MGVISLSKSGTGLSWHGIDGPRCLTAGQVEVGVAQRTPFPFAHVSDAGGPVLVWGGCDSPSSHRFASSSAAHRPANPRDSPEALWEMTP